MTCPGIELVRVICTKGAFEKMNENEGETNLLHNKLNGSSLFFVLLFSSHHLSTVPFFFFTAFLSVSLCGQKNLEFTRSYTNEAW